MEGAGLAALPPCEKRRETALPKKKISGFAAKSKVAVRECLVGFILIEV